MGNLIISKKGRAPGALVFCSILMLLMGMLTFLTSDLDTDFGYKVEIYELLTLASPFFLIIAGFIIGISAYRHTQTYINVYSDHIEGCGVLGKGGTRAQNFYFNLDNRYTVSREGNFICVNCNNSSYYINLSAVEVAEVYNAAVNPNLQMSKSNLVFQCPGCRANCSIPPVSGKIRITCPKCGNSFTVEN